MNKMAFLKRHPVLSALVLVVCAGGLVFAGYANCWFGCVDLSDETVAGETAESVSRILGTRKALSLAAWEDLRIGDEEAREYARDRFSLLISGEASITFKNVKFDEKSQTTSARLVVNFDQVEKSDGGGELSTATAITSDGYFLTAAHCVDTEPLYLLSASEKGFETVRARTVWIGSPDGSDEPDLALIHAPFHPERHFPLLRADEVSHGTKVLTAGYGGLKLNQAGGMIQKHSTWKTSASGARWMELYHDAPVAQGDSGGPLINAEGQLLGINAIVKGQFHRILGRDFLFRYHCGAVAPDSTWIRKLIIEDRANSQ